MNTITELSKNAAKTSKCYW